ncbi:MAG: YkgJ family cysteine cluster protein [Vicinamibacteria bacterium]|nr:YkgJ family cysteine cluster protein [Vicinamibacteria bacterium]
MRPARGEAEALDAALVAGYDAALARATQCCGPALRFDGCPACCLGPFPISAADAWRLRRGLAALAAAEPQRAEAVRTRARAAIEAFGDEFPGDHASGRLGPDEAAEETFAERFASLRCPALEQHDRCALYASRPLACRSYGPPVRIAGADLPPCERCFAGDAALAESCRVALDPEDREAALLAALGETRETVIAFALLQEDR